MDKFDQLKESYNKLKNDFKYLPLFEDLENEFYLSGACYNINSKIVSPLKLIRSSILNYYNFLLNYLHDFIYPNRQSAILMEEFKSINEKDKDEIVKIIGELMITVRKNVKLNIFHNQKDEAKFIQSSFQRWIIIKKRLKPIINNNISFWENYSD